MADTVFAHIASSISQKENLATEALAFILNRSPAARVALDRYLLGLLEQVRPVARVVTQVAVGEESRPDLVLLAEDGHRLGYIEAKFWAALTAAQPVEYVRHLMESAGTLLVLAPERRLPTLRLELRERLAIAGLTPTDVTSTSMTSGGVRIGLLSWTKLLAVIRDAVADDRASSSDVHQLEGLVTRLDGDGFVPLTREDLDAVDVPRRMMALANLVNDIVEAAVSDGILSVKGLKATHFIHGTGRYAAFKWAGMWLGLDHAAWAAWGRTPLWITFATGPWGRADQIRSCLQGWLNADPPRAYGDHRDIHVPVLLATGCEKERVVTSAVAQLRELDVLLSAAGLPPLDGEGPREP